MGETPSTSELLHANIKKSKQVEVKENTMNNISQIQKMEND
jgi:hypothetical protein